MRTQEKIGLFATFGIMLALMPMIMWVLPNMDDGSIPTSCGERTFYHPLTNSCELFAPLPTEPLTWISCAGYVQVCFDAHIIFNQDKIDSCFEFNGDMQLYNGMDGYVTVCTS